jgi:acylphosphatase
MIEKWVFMKARAHIFVSGFVQGVFFRSNTQERARQLGLKGWVRNLEDGRVEAVFEGEKEKVLKMIEWAERGPEFAKVENIEVNWEEYKGEFDDFEIRYAQ